MQAIVIAIITTAIGVTVAFWAARHYYTRSVKHRLAIYWLPVPSILSDVDSDTRKELSIQFRGETVNELAVAEFLIVNEGASPIRESMEPLTFTITNEGRIVDASVTYIHPEGRKILVEPTSEKGFRCDFPLLNPDEYFYVKLITDGRVSKSDIVCQIVAENLPPRIQIENPSGRLSISSEDDRRDLGLLGLAAVVLIIGASIFLPLVALYQARHGYFPFSGARYHFIWWLSPALVIAGLIAIVLLWATVAIIGAAFFGEFPPGKRLKGPRRPYHLYSYGAFPGGAESDNAVTRYPRQDMNNGSDQ